MKDRARVALAGIVMGLALVGAAGCHKGDPATAENRDSNVDKQQEAQTVQINSSIPPQARAAIQAQVQAHGGYSSTPGAPVKK